LEGVRTIPEPQPPLKRNDALQHLTKMRLVPAVALEFRAHIFAFVHEWQQWFANKGGQAPVLKNY
jgi:hypothetical protein